MVSPTDFEDSQATSSSRQTFKMQQISLSGVSNSDKSNYKNLIPGADPSLEALRLYYKAEKELKGILMKPRMYNAPFEKEGGLRKIGKYKPAKLKKSNLCPYNTQTRHVGNPIVRDKAFIRSNAEMAAEPFSQLEPVAESKKEDESIQQKIYRPIPIKP
jgi:hypothetical protein